MSFKRGDVVKYKFPEQGEESIRFTVLDEWETHGGRGVLRCQLIDENFTIKPISDLPAEEMEVVSQKGE